MKSKQTVILLDGMVKIDLSGDIERLRVQAAACRRFLDKILED